VTTNNVTAVSESDIVILAVKPQVLPIILDELKGKIPPTALVLSIVAGARIATLVSGLEHEAIVRSMPNTPAQIGEGMVVWTAVDAVSEKQRKQATAILQSMGLAIYVHEEKQLDMATAVNGSGPAYVFLFMEAMIDAAVRLGFSWPVARQLVLQTVLGSVLYARQTDVHLAELRNQVTTPAGTTAEALHELEKGALRVVINEAIQAAYQQSRRLAGAD
jgi:pyrroline-5-carboxylate reductase